MKKYPYKSTELDKLHEEWPSKIEKFVTENPKEFATMIKKAVAPILKLQEAFLMKEDANPLVDILNKYRGNFDEVVRQKMLTFLYNLDIRQIPPENMDKAVKGWKMFLGSLSKVPTMNQPEPEEKLPVRQGGKWQK